MTSITNLKLNNNAVQNEVSENKKVEIIEQQGGTAIEFNDKIWGINLCTDIGFYR